MTHDKDKSKANPLRLLLVEDSANDAKLLLKALDRGGFAAEHRRVDDRVGMLDALQSTEWDVIVSDYSMPGFGGLEALEIYQASGLDMPFILVSGTIGEDVAVACMRQGAHDYLMKNSLTRLPEAIRRGLLAAEDRRTRRESDETLQLLFDGASDGILLADSKTRRMVRANRAMCQMLGYTPDEIVKLTVQDLHQDEESRSMIAFFDALSKNETSIPTTILMKRKDGNVLPVEISARPIELHGRTHLLGMFRDISERNLAVEKQELHASVLAVLNRPNEWRNLIRDLLIEIKDSTGIEAVGIRLPEGGDFPYFETQGFPAEFVERERYLCDRCETGALVCDDEGKPILECMCGNVILGRTDATLPFFTEKGSFWANNTTRMLATTTEKDLQAHTRNQCNSSGYESVALIPLQCGGETIGLLQLNDHRADRFTLDMIHFLENLGASIGIGFARFRDRDEMERLARFPSENPNPVMRIFGDGTVQYANKPAAPLQEAMGAQVSEPVSATWMKRVQEAIVAGHTIDGEEAIGNRIIAFSLTPVAGQDYVNLYGQDITARRTLEAQLVQSQKLESIGTLASGVAHEINNPIMGIMNYAQLIQDEMDEESPLREYASEIMVETDRVATIVKNLLGFAREDTQTDCNPTRMVDIVNGVLSLVGTVMKHDQITLTIDVPKDLPQLSCHSQQIQQVLMNLLTNARDALNEKYARADKDKIVRISAQLISDIGHRYVRITIEDHGGGIAPEVHERMFDPFFTTKPKDKGTGLGLSISHGIVRDHGGQLSVESEPGQWTRFHLDLPVE